VTYPRVKLTASDMDVGGEGRNRLPRFDGFISNYRRETSHYRSYPWTGYVYFPVETEIAQVKDPTVQREVEWSN
jgi:hypothetical protein